MDRSKRWIVEKRNCPLSVPCGVSCPFRTSPSPAPGRRRVRRKRPRYGFAMRRASVSLRPRAVPEMTKNAVIASARRRTVLTRLFGHRLLPGRGALYDRQRRVRGGVVFGARAAVQRRIVWGLESPAALVRTDREHSSPRRPRGDGGRTRSHRRVRKSPPARRGPEHGGKTGPQEHAHAAPRHEANREDNGAIRATATRARSREICSGSLEMGMSGALLGYGMRSADTAFRGSKAWTSTRFSRLCQ